MFSNDFSHYFYVTIIIIFILIGIKNNFFNDIHWYEFCKFIIALCLIIFILFINIVFIQKIWNKNKIVPEEGGEIEINNEEINNEEITIQAVVVNS